jgi:SNF2 family DNA or RNA helicase
LIPDARIVDGRLHVPHTPATQIILKTIGIELPHAVTAHYDFNGGTPFEIQKRTVELLTEYPRCYVLSSFGTGKTRCVIWAFDYLRKIVASKRCLIIAPLSTLRFVWAREIFQTAPELKVNVLHGNRAKRLKLLADPADCYVINPDGLGIIADIVAKRTDIDLIVIDELAMFRNRTKRTKILRKLAWLKPHVWGLTGAPTPNAPTDVFEQARIVTPATVAMPFTRFREELMYKVTDFKWVPRPGAIEKAVNVLVPSVRFTLDDVMELPEFVSQNIDVELSPLQKTIYEDIRKHCWGMINGGEISAVNAAGAMTKLLQISLGWVYDKHGNTIDLDASRRLEALGDLIEASSNKVLVFVPYKHALAGVTEYLKKRGFDAVAVSGDTPHKERADIFNLFQNTERYNPLVAHPGVAAHGLTFTAADTVAWFGPITSLEMYDQANARIRRVGQKHKQLFAHFQATPIERKVYKLLINKIDAQDALLQLLEDLTEE